MRISALLLAPVALLGLSASAQAADITYNVTSGSFSPSGTFSGSFNFNPSTNMVDGGSFTASAGGTIYTFSTTASGTSAGSEVFRDASSDIFRLNLNLDTGSLGLNLLGALNSVGIPYNTGSDTALILASGTQYNAVGGTVAVATTAATTPEPSSLILLGTGALGVAGSLRRRILG